MKRGTGINCIEFTGGGNMLKVPPAATDPNDNNLNLEVKVFKLNPDGSKGELIRIEPAFPEGWDTPAPYNNKKLKEDEVMPPAREDKDVILKKAQDLIDKGETVSAVAKQLKVPFGTLYGWLKKAEKTKTTQQEIPVGTWENAVDEPVPHEHHRAGIEKGSEEAITVNVRWHDGYPEGFECQEVRFGCDFLWMRFTDGNNRHIPLRSVRWFSVTPESREHVASEEGR